MTARIGFAGAALFLGGALFVFGGCAAPSRDAARGGSALRAEGASVIPGVPFLPQEEDTCGPSSLAMLLRFLGKEATTAGIARETRTEGLRGTLVTDLAAAARRRGVDAEVVDLDVGRLRGEIARGTPVILLVDLGTWAWSRPHYMLAFGVTADAVVAHSGRAEGKVIPIGELDAQWAKMGRLSIVVRRGAP